MSKMATPTTEASEAAVPQAAKKTFPLNSGRLTGIVMRRVAKELGLSVSASLEDMRQIVSGEIEAAGREPRNVRVELTESERGTKIALRDEEGVFLECHPEDLDADGASEGVRERDGEQRGGGDEGGRRR